MSDVTSVEPAAVQMRHEGVENAISVPVARVARYEARGWERVDGVDTDQPYAKWKKAALVAEVARRNAERPEDDQVVVGGTGTIADLAAALEADDKAHPEA